MSATRKREGFKGQRAIVIPAKILARHFDNHPIVKQLYITDIGTTQTPYITIGKGVTA
jgi:hypothetical protein